MRLDAQVFVKDRSAGGAFPVARPGMFNVPEGFESGLQPLLVGRRRLDDGTLLLLKCSRILLPVGVGLGRVCEPLQGSDEFASLFNEADDRIDVAGFERQAQAFAQAEERVKHSR